MALNHTCAGPNPARAATFNRMPIVHATIGFYFKEYVFREYVFFKSSSQNKICTYKFKYFMQFLFGKNVCTHKKRENKIYLATILPFLC